MTDTPKNPAAVALRALRHDYTRSTEAIQRVNAERELLGCNCTQAGGKHTSTCRIYLREAKRKSWAKKKEVEEIETK